MTHQFCSDCSTPIIFCHLDELDYVGRGGLFRYCNSVSLCVVCDTGATNLTISTIGGIAEKDAHA